MEARFHIYRVDPRYCSYLHDRYDSRVGFNDKDKVSRPFLGIAFTIDGMDYFAPMSSYKPERHDARKEHAAFMKMEKYGVINICNMIPVPRECLVEVDIHTKEDDSEETINHKNLLNKELTWCNRNRGKILRNMHKVYHWVRTRTASPFFQKLCCDFPKLEAGYIAYCEKHGYTPKQRSETYADLLQWQKVKFGQLERYIHEEPAKSSAKSMRILLTVLTKEALRVNDKDHVVLWENVLLQADTLYSELVKEAKMPGRRKHTAPRDEK